MTYLIFILATLLLLAAFLLLSIYETQKGTRVFARGRVRLDENVERVKFVLAHVDFGLFLREETFRIARRIAHDIAHFSLRMVRAVERFLTHLVRYLRIQRASDITPRGNAREFVKTLSDFKDHLETTRPKIPDIY
ncbi:MAG: hypothetical protein ABSB00_01385 [Minisyncoccia bacterium]|jgi:hypothetical protein